jgi:hypothetical protein
MVDSFDELGGICNDRQCRYCSSCGQRLVRDRIFISFVDGKVGENLIPCLQKILDLVKMLEGAGWTIIPSVRGIECKCPQDNELSAMDQLRALGASVELVRECLCPVPVRVLKEIRQATVELREDLDFRRSVREDDLFGLCRQLEHHDDEDSGLRFDPDDALIIGQLMALRWVLGNDKEPFADQDKETRPAV